MPSDELAMNSESDVTTLLQLATSPAKAHATKWNDTTTTPTVKSKGKSNHINSTKQSRASQAIYLLRLLQ
jgi:hypothetical protein